MHFVTKDDIWGGNMEEMREMCLRFSPNVDNTRYKAIDDFDPGFFHPSQTEPVIKLIKDTFPSVRISLVDSRFAKCLIKHIELTFDDPADEAFFLVWSSDIIIVPYYLEKTVPSLWETSTSIDASIINRI